MRGAACLGTLWFDEGKSQGPTAPARKKSSIAHRCFEMKSYDPEV